MFAKTTRHYTIFTDSLCKSTKKKGIHKRNDAKSESPGTDPNFFAWFLFEQLTDVSLSHLLTHGFFEGKVWWVDAFHAGETCF
jgi:hypothetical protein